MKRLLKILLFVLVLVVIALAACPLWLGPVARCVANRVVPSIAGVDFSVDEVSVNPYAGHFHVAGVRLANPTGYAAKDAVRVKRFSVDVAVGDLFSNLLHVRDVTIDAPFASYMSYNSVNNFDAILANVKKNLNLKKKEKKEEEEKNPMKVCIDHLRIADVSYRISIMPFDLPLGFPIELNGLGTEGADGESASEGVTFEEMGALLVSAVSEVVAKSGKGLSKALDLGLDSTKAVSSTAVDAAKAVTSTAEDAVKATGSAVDSAARTATEATKGLFKSATKLFGN